MIMDLHNHTIFSYDGKDTPEAIIENAIDCGIDAVGITDHQFSIGSDIGEYIARLSECKAKYAPYIKVLIGLEIGTRPRPSDLFIDEIGKLDYVLFECLDDVRAMDLWEFIAWRQRFECPVGLAHCDIFALGERLGTDMLDVLKKENIFWELNTSGNYIYYYDFLTNVKKREAVKSAHIGVSVGSDTHAVYQYRESQVKSANKLISEMGLPLPFML